MKNFALMALLALTACGNKRPHEQVVHYPAPVEEQAEAPQYAPTPQPVPQYVAPAPAPVQQPVVVRERSNDGLLWYMMGRATAPSAPTHVYHAPPPPVYHAPAPVVHRTTTVYRSAPTRQAPRVAPTYKPSYKPAPAPRATKPFRLYKR